MALWGWGIALAWSAGPDEDPDGDVPADDDTTPQQAPVDPDDATPPEDPSEDRDTVDLTTDETFGSALDDFASQAEVIRLSDEDRLGDLTSLPQGLVRGRWGVRPMTAVTFLPADPLRWAARLGVTASHQWWVLTPTAVQIGGETEATALFPVGGASGRRFELNTVIGPWLGPVGLRVGPILRSDRTVWREGGVVFEDSLSLGARASVTLALGALRPTLGIEPRWLVAGPRIGSDPSTAAWPVIGDETGYHAGLGWMGRPVSAHVLTSLQQTGVGTEIDVTLGLSLQF